MISRRDVSVRRALLAIAPVAFAVLAADAGAQGNGKAKPGPGGGNDAKPVVVQQQAKPQAKARGGPPGHAKKRHTHAEAVDISRQVLVAQGYTVARVEQVGGTRVIYYYRGSNGRGRGRGPLQRIVVRPSAERYVFEGAPRTVLSEVTRRMGL